MRNEFYKVLVSLFTLAVVAGCSTTSEMIEEPTVQAEQEAVPEQVAIQEPAQAAPEADVTLQTTFYFDFDDATLRPDVREVLAAHAERIKTESQNVRIEGYADDRGTETYNKALGQRRAEAVRDLLISKGVNASQIETLSFGEKNPQASGSGEIVWQQNRRVVLK
ncbi:OmpA family protein [Kaarinaea lacus]